MFQQNSNSKLTALYEDIQTLVELLKFKKIDTAFVHTIALQKKLQDWIEESEERVNVSEAAKVLKVSDKTILRWIHQGKLHADKFGRNYLIRISEIIIRQKQPTSKRLASPKTLEILGLFQKKEEL